MNDVYKLNEQLERERNSLTICRGLLADAELLDDEELIDSLRAEESERLRTIRQLRFDVNRLWEYNEDTPGQRDFRAAQREWARCRNVYSFCSLNKDIRDEMGSAGRAKLLKMLSKDIGISVQDFLDVAYCTVKINWLAARMRTSTHRVASMFSEARDPQSNDLLSRERILKALFDVDPREACI